MSKVNIFKLENLGFQADLSDSGLSLILEAAHDTDVYLSGIDYDDDWAYHIPNKFTNEFLITIYENNCEENGQIRFKAYDFKTYKETVVKFLADNNLKAKL
jgi:hypothetical protein